MLNCFVIPNYATQRGEFKLKSAGWRLGGLNGTQKQDPRSAADPLWFGTWQVHAPSKYICPGGIVQIEDLIFDVYESLQKFTIFNIQDHPCTRARLRWPQWPPDRANADCGPPVSPDI